MATRSKTSAETSTAVLDAPNGERERVFDAYRRWGYLEADLDPLGHRIIEACLDGAHQEDYRRLIPHPMFRDDEG